MSRLALSSNSESEGSSWNYHHMGDGWHNSSASRVHMVWIVHARHAPGKVVKFCGGSWKLLMPSIVWGQFHAAAMTHNMWCNATGTCKQILHTLPPPLGPCDSILHTNLTSKFQWWIVISTAMILVGTVEYIMLPLSRVLKLTQKQPWHNNHPSQQLSRL